MPLATERWIRITMAMVFAAAGAYLIYRLRFVLVTVALAAMLAYAFLPLVEYATRLRIGRQPLPRFGAVSLVFTLAIAAIFGGSHLAAAPVGDQVHRFAQNVGQYRDQLSAALTRTRATLDEGLPPDLRDSLDNGISQSGTLLVSALGHVARATADWLSHVVEIVLIPILAFYFLVDLPVLKRELLGLLPLAARQPVLGAAACLDPIMASYVRGQLILMAISGIVVWAGLTVIGVRLALLLGIVAGLTRAVPIIGPVLGILPILGVVLLQSAHTAVVVGVFFIILQVVESKAILPHVIGHHLQLHAVTILIALLVGNALFGLIGMILAPPAAAFARELLALIERGDMRPWPREVDREPSSRRRG